MAERPDQILVYLALVSPLVLAILLMIPVRGWWIGRWPAGAAWSAFGLTLLGTFPVVLLEWQVLQVLIKATGDIWSGLATSIILLSYLEEALKIAAIGLTALAFRRSLATRPALFLAIGAATGIAFATIENLLFLYAINESAPNLLWRVTLLRTFGPLPMHIVCAMVAAWFLAQAFAGRGRRAWLRALMTAGTLHLLFNGMQILGDALGETRVPMGSDAHIYTYGVAVLVVYTLGLMLWGWRDRIPKPAPD
jgi:hypothetical protein